MITIKNLSVSYPNKTNIIQSMNLELESGKVHGIAGLNGSGKTTLLNTIFGLIKPKSGSISNDSHKLTKQHISYLPTDTFFYSYISGQEYLALFHNPSFDTENWNKLFGLPLNQICDEYSSGMKKKLALMGVLKQEKAILILDEPFNNLDIETNRILRALLLRMKNQGTTIIITSHIIETLTNLCDNIHYLELGKIKYSRDKKDFAAFEHELFESIERKTQSTIDKLFD